MYVMGALAIMPAYFMWHYTRGYADYIRIWSNYMWFIGHFFSVGFLIKTFFVPLFQMRERYESIADIGSVASTFLLNTVIRLVSAIVRSCIIIVGLVALAVTGVIGVIGLIIWTAAPVLIVVGFTTGLSLLL